MKKKKWYILLAGGMLIVALGAITIPKLMESGTLSFGFPQNEFVDLGNGTYVVREINFEPGKYAIYTREGRGTVHVDETEYQLDGELFEKAEQQIFVKDTVIYEESPKVFLSDDTIITVVGGEDFKLSFLRR
jgi:hypothetical protein